MLGSCLRSLQTPLTVFCQLTPSKEITLVLEFTLFYKIYFTAKFFVQNENIISISPFFSVFTSQLDS